MIKSKSVRELGCSLTGLIRLTKPQIRLASRTLAEVFQDNPLFGYFIPDASERKCNLHYMFEVMVRYCVMYGEVYTTSKDMEGVALWLPPDNVEMSMWKMMRSGGLSLYFRFGKEVMPRTMSFMDNVITPIHKNYAAFRHWYLYLIGVRSVLQGKGYASALLRPMLARIDQENLPCYLEPLDEIGVSIYRHYGFKVVSETKIPNTNVSIWAMIREAKLAK